MEDGVFANSVREEEAGHGALVDDVQATCIMQADPV